MEFILKKYLSAIALLWLMSPCTHAQEEVYRWVDENGVVHYSDQARSEKAKLFELRQYNKAQPAVSAEDLAANNDALASIASDNTKVEKEQVMKQTPAQNCAALKKQMIIAQAQLQSNDPNTVLRARMYLETADNLLTQSNCN